MLSTWPSKTPPGHLIFRWSESYCHFQEFVAPPRRDSIILGPLLLHRAVSYLRAKGVYSVSLPGDWHKLEEAWWLDYVFVWWNLAKFGPCLSTFSLWVILILCCKHGSPTWSLDSHPHYISQPESVISLPFRAIIPCKFWKAKKTIQNNNNIKTH